MLATFSLHSVVNSAGAYAGFAALIGLALLVLLYFAQARELRRLSEWVDGEEQRRLAAPPPLSPLPRATVIAQGLPPVAPATGAITTAVPGARRVAVPVGAGVPVAAAAPELTAVVAPAPGAPSDAGNEGSGPPASPIAPATAAAQSAAADQEQAEAAPEPALAPPDPEDARPRPPAPDDAPPRPPAPDDAPPRPAAVPLAGPRVPTAEPRPAVVAEPSATDAPATDPELEPTRRTAPPERAPVAEAEPAEPPLFAPATPAGSRTRFPPSPDVRAQPVAGSANAMMAAPTPFAVPPTPEGDPFDIEPTRRRPSGRGPGDEPPRRSSEDLPPRSPWASVRLLLVAVVIVAVLIFVVTQLIGGSSGPSTANTTTSQTTTQTTTGHSTGTGAKVPPPAPDTVTVSVLNGTTVSHLASGAWARLAARGFKQGSVADAPAQNHAVTTVGYVSGAHAAAVEVARDLALATADVAPVDSATLAAGSTGGASPQVVVTLGSDYAQSR